MDSTVPPAHGMPVPGQIGAGGHGADGFIVRGTSNEHHRSALDK
jgi:hypothetical protein